MIQGIPKYVVEAKNLVYILQKTSLPEIAGTGDIRQYIQNSRNAGQFCNVCEVFCNFNTFKNSASLHLNHL